MPLIPDWPLSLSRNLIGNFVVLGPRQDVALYQIAGVVIGTSRDNPISLRIGHVRQAQQLIFRGRIQIERFVAVPALAYTLRHSFGIALDFRSRLGGLFTELIRALFLITGCQRAQQENCGNGSRSHAIHRIAPLRRP